MNQLPHKLDILSLLTPAVEVDRLVKDLPGADWTLRAADSEDRFLELLKARQPDLCLVEFLGRTPEDGRLLSHLAAHHPSLPVVAFCPQNHLRDLIEAMKLGAASAVATLDAASLKGTIEQICPLMPAADESTRRGRKRWDVRCAGDIVGDSEQIEGLRTLIARTANTDVPVLVIGETGTGKQIVASALHYSSDRRQGPFVEVNCAALTETLLESELFGHEKGAFTGADRMRLGKFEQADGGTIFLDEISDMPANTQAKVLRVLQEMRFQRVGGEETKTVDVRVIAASNRDLREQIRRGRFREDLYYRINTMILEIPPLRSRPADIPKQANFCLARTLGQTRTGARRITGPALDLLMRYPWPGNVRELCHVIQRAAILCDGPEIGIEHLPPAIRLNQAEIEEEPTALPVALERLERRMILKALEECGGVKASAARKLGITKRAISYKMQRLGIRVEKRDREGRRRTRPGRARP